MIKEHHAEWRAYQENPSEENLTQLINCYWWFVNIVYRNKFWHFRQHKDEYISHGAMALVRAIKQYDANDERDFKSYLYASIYHGMVNAHRKVMRQTRHTFLEEEEFSLVSHYDGTNQLDVKDLLQHIFQEDKWLYHVLLDRYGNNLTFRELHAKYPQRWKSYGNFYNSLKREQERLEHNLQNETQTLK